MKTKMIVRPDNIAIRFDKKSFFSTILGFNPHWDHKHYDEYFSQKVMNLDSIKKSYKNQCYRWKHSKWS